MATCLLWKLEKNTVRTHVLYLPLPSHSPAQLFSSVLAHAHV